MTTLQSHLSHRKYRPDIDGLRSIAVLSVVAFHAFPSWVKGGFIGVDVFFVISGYLISMIIFENLDGGTFSFAEFYARRIKRIFPALLIVLVASYAFGWFVLVADEYKQLGKHIAAGAGFISNIVFWNEAGYFDNSAESKPLLHLWSLGIEEQFYIIWPLLLWLAWNRKFNLLTITILVAVVSFYLNVKGIKKDAVATFYSPQTRFWELLCGSSLAWVTLYKKDAFSSVKTKLDDWLASIVYRDKPEVDGKTFSNVISFIGLLLLAYGFWKINKELSFPGKWAVVPVLGAVLIISAGPKAWVNRTILSNKVAVWFGLISFPLYLWHWPLLSFARILSIEYPSRNVRISVVVVSVILSWLTYKLVERPIRLGNFGRLKTSFLLFLMLLCSLVGYNTYSRNGYEFRGIVKYVDSLYNSSSRQYESNFLASYKNYSGGDISRSKKPVVLIVGDSYNKSWAAALNTRIDVDKFDVVSISYLGCAVKIDAKRITVVAANDEYKSDCESFDFFINNESVAKRLSAVMLVSHKPFEYTSNLFRFDVIRWLKQNNDSFELFVFGNYFQLDPQKYPSCEKLMARAHRGSEVCLEYANYPLIEPKNETLALYPSDLNFKYIDIIKLHCNYSKAGCSTQAKGVPFMSDWNHLNATFLESILRDIQINKASNLAELGLLKYLSGTSR